MENEDGILCSFNEFLEHLQKHMKDLHADVPLNDRLYSEEDYPKLKALLVESGALSCSCLTNSQFDGTKHFEIASSLFGNDGGGSH